MIFPRRETFPIQVYLASVFWVGFVLCTDLAQALTTAAEELEHLDHDFSEA